MPSASRSPAQRPGTNRVRTTSMSDVDTGNLTFVEYYLPPLASGEYTVTVTQKVSLGEIDFQGNTIASSTSRTYSNDPVTFFVRGERFALKPDEVQSFFPAENAAGDFSLVLPHVVITKKVLPWEWTVSGGAQIPTPTGDVSTWMALLVFDSEDPTPPTVMRTLAELLNPPSGVVSYPDLVLAPGESSTDPVATIDVPVALFSQMAPSAADLVHLAHSRQVAPNNKSSDSVNSQADYSVLIANRLPYGQKTTVHLVCLEGMARYLPGSNQSPPAGTEAIRLASLLSWQFTAATEQVEFADALRQAITPGLPSTLRLPCSGSTTQAVSDALSMGYTACAHQTRFGTSTVSWYRGPLVPFVANPAKRLKEVVRNPDALLRYNPNTGMFDTAYSAAWQLGRLLALQNKEYAVALYRWKHDSQTMATPPPPPDVVNSWLGRLVLLYGIPFNYLVPDERMLPPESLRFFQVDPFWMDCLMDGAFSLGRATSSVLDHDTGMFDQLRQNAVAAARRARINWIADSGGTPPPPTPGDGPITGFLLRSKVISEYPGMEVFAYATTDLDDRTDPRAFLRFERITPNLLLCLVDGSIGKVLIRQAPEGLHFGLDPGENNTFVRGFRSITDGTVMDPPAPVPVQFRSDTTKVVDIDQLAASMASALAGQLGQTKFTSDIFALEMVEGVREVFYVHKS